ncbi:ABC transporter permease/M1 family aminopeptidase [Pedobacter montanisoli]|uniref:Peptidase M1 membrane alanine aminopeptidase domain-containing protein n=1 Tax=Pedobacter montanisoli TaxID=2923277 RepID=A0ABS9ZRQ6_9SPHI|nr:M1 family aminopeptidase [Pedobacter montanisoli]MCJ0741271.1 hypothetical protein [Pedobacter montanisoli]
MKTLFLFDIKSYLNRFWFYLLSAFILSFGCFAGLNFNLSVGNGIYLNSPYVIGFISGLLSLAIIFMGTVFSLQLFFKDHDSRFDLLLFTTPLVKWKVITARLLTTIILSILLYILLIIGFATGQHMRTGAEITPHFNVMYYLYPVVFFGLINGLFIVAILLLTTVLSGNKLLVAVIGVLLYILYMVSLLFSNSPFMAQSLPQSADVQQISAILDPFGLSAYFLTSKDYTINQRNGELVHLDSYFLINRIFFTLLSTMIILWSVRLFSGTRESHKKARTNVKIQSLNPPQLYTGKYISTDTCLNFYAQLRSVFSFVKIDLRYTFKSIAFAVTSLAILFHVGMEMYAEIEKGIRIPQKYVSSGLMATTIIENFHLIGLFIIIYYVNDIVWRGKTNRFNLIEDSTSLAKNKNKAHFLSIMLLILCFTLLLILQGICFQFAYNYPHFDLAAYAGVFIFNSFPLILTAGILIFINKLFKHKYAALGISIIVALIIASPISKKLIAHPLLLFLTEFKAIYSDFIAYGTYLTCIVYRLLFGTSFLLFIWVLVKLFTNRKSVLRKIIALSFLFTLGCFAAHQYTKGYTPKNNEALIRANADYEKHFRHYQNMPQPTITKVKTLISLYPSKQAYKVEGSYVLKNLEKSNIHSILVNFTSGFTVKTARFISKKDTLFFSKPISELKLKHPLTPGEQAYMEFEFSYQWAGINGHQPFNAIIENGSFIRISRYFPSFGYQADNEIAEDIIRREYNLGPLTATRKLNEPKILGNDFIDLDMTISTEKNQIAIGVGELAKEWKKDGRNYFKYKTSEVIPFRFALSSARYQIKSSLYKNRKINIFYHSKHHENVDHLISNIKLTLDYCEKHFGKYPFKTINFAEVSSFTRGFAATAYPETIYMTEDMIFHANITADKQQDVINELAGHELSHIWWGNNLISPDGREGSPMLTETLAMYTEMMLYQKMHGTKAMLERLKMHLQIYNSEKGFSKEEALYKVTAENTHISYSKGAVAMYLLSRLIGEDKVNKALSNFLTKHKYPNAHPVTNDLLAEFYAVSDKRLHREIDILFKTTQPIKAEQWGLK